MSDNSNITRNDLVAVAYVLYSSLCESFSKPHIDPQGFAADCKKAFEEFSDE